MNRKAFLKKSAFAAGGLYFLPHFLLACKKENPFKELKFKGSVGIVGAGAAGLYAAYLLKQNGIDVEIFEASDHIGGRIRSLQGFTDFPIDLGAEEIHGERSIWYDAVREAAPEFISADLEDIYFFNNIKYTGSEFENSPEYAQISALIDAIADYNGSDITALAYANVQQLPESLIPFFNAWVGNENGTDISRIGMTGLAQAEREWRAGEENIMMRNRDMHSVLTQVFASAIPSVRLNKPITKIDYQAGKVVLTDNEENTYTKDRVIVTSSVKVLFDQLIEFIPTLPSLHLQAISNIGMGAGFKLILKFQQPFWPTNTGSIYIPGPVPEFWATGDGGRSAANNVLTAFVHGAYAENLLADLATLVPSVLASLDACFGDNIATNTFVDHHLMNWGAEEYIRGTYSFPIPGTSNDARMLLGKPVNNKVYFAGEACGRNGHHGTVHGALESALHAVEKILLTP
ncbi:MAG: flavin monoamine oxidase family protein [Flavobacteriales bacterium]|jgi:monoamine oxidase